MAHGWTSTTIHLFKSLSYFCHPISNFIAHNTQNPSAGADGFVRCVTIFSFRYMARHPTPRISFLFMQCVNLFDLIHTGRIVLPTKYTSYTCTWLIVHISEMQSQPGIIIIIANVP